MSTERDIDLINDLLVYADEQPWLEFKHNNEDQEMIGKLCSALSNGARASDHEIGYVLWGIKDETKEVIGTTFDPASKLIGSQEFNLWLAQRLSPSPSFHFRVVEHPNGRVVILEIPAPTTAPIAFNNQSYIRIGSATPKLSDFPERFAQLIEKMRPYTWETSYAKQFVSTENVLSLLDYTSYFKLTKQTLPDNSRGVLEKLSAENLIVNDVGGKWNITNLGAILFANDLEDFDTAIARKAVRLIAYEGKNRATTVTNRRDGQRGYANGFAGLVDYINALIPINEHIGDAFRKDQPLFPSLAIRELIANALIHQDMTISGTGPQIEIFQDRMEITNPGQPLVEADRMIDLPPRSRNEAIASLMRRMALCEEQGSGLDKVIMQAEIFQLPPPNFRDNDSSMQVTLYAPRAFANMTPIERSRACYQHAIIKFLSGERMKNSSLCERFGIDSKNAAQASSVIRKCLDDGYIKPADKDHPRAGYIPIWA